jgi:ABC-type glycerol-3-phosphate transport system substrate-binding protein
MPLAIADYTSTYDTMVIFAPEISGLWEFTPLPGTFDPETETINNSTIAAVSSLIMMRGATEKNALSAWTFMQWWSSAEVQSTFGNEKIALLGPSAKYSTANIEALQKMSWSKDELDNLVAQFNAVECTPEYPGSYIIGRFTNFAFLGAYNNDDNPVEKMRSYLDDINAELTRKRQEFDLPTTETFKELGSVADDK